MKNNFMKAFTLIEVLLYTVIFAIVGGLTTGILLTVTQVQQRESASAEVTGQLNFVMQRIQYLVRESSNIEITAGVTTSTLKLRMKATSTDPTCLSLVNNVIKLAEGQGTNPNNCTSTTSDLTSDRVTVDKLEFKKFTQYPGHDTLSLDIQMTYNTQNPKSRVQRNLSSAIARVSAATFDSSLLPGSTSFTVGQAGSAWQNVFVGDGSAASPSYSFGSDTNVGIFRPGADILGFTTNSSERMRIDASGNVGIGILTPAYRLDVTGLARLGGVSFAINPEFSASDNTVTNLLTANMSNIETDTTGWTAAGTNTTRARDTVEYWEGAASLKVITDGSVEVAGARTSSIAVTASQTYTATAYVKGQGTVRIRLQELDSSNANIGYANSATTTLSSNNWTRFSITRTFGATGVNARVWVATAAAQAITFYIDGIQLEQRDSATAWITGGLTRNQGDLNLTGRIIVTGTGNNLFNGNVGIGTTGPTNKLHVNASVSDNLVRFENDSTAYNDSSIRFRAKSSAGANAHMDFGIKATGSETGYFYFKAPYNSSERMVIDTSGNVGIGTTDPGAKLEVAGVLKASAIQTTSYFSAAPASTLLGNANNWTNSPLATITLSVSIATKALVTYNISGVCGASSNHVVSRVVLDGSVIRGTPTIVNPASAYYGLQGSAVVDLSAGSHTFQLQYRTPATDCYAYYNGDWADTSLSVIVLGN